MTDHTEITAEELAKQQGVNPKSLRAKLRKAFPQHPKNSRWIARVGSAEHRVWLGLAAELRGA